MVQPVLLVLHISRTVISDLYRADGSPRRSLSVRRTRLGPNRGHLINWPMSSTCGLFVQSTLRISVTKGLSVFRRFGL